MKIPSISALQSGGGRRFAILGMAVAVVLGVWGVGRWAATPTFVTLYHDLDLKESGAIAQQLGKSGIQFRLEGGGAEVRVPATDLARARVALAQQGLPSSGRPGLELFDKPAWGMTDFTQRVTYQRALEGELARTLGGLRGIERAQVHLVLPTPSNLRRLERPAGASIVVTLKPNAMLSPESVQGIAYIVSNSVEGLSSENVAIMDDSGRVLSVPSASGSGAAMTTRHLEIQRTVEQHLVSKIEDLLATVVGYGHARAEVSAELSFDQVDRTVESFDPDGQVLQNEQRSEPPATGTEAGPTVMNNSYQNSRRLEKIVGSVGSVRRLSVAVLVDEKTISGTGVATARLENLEAMVREAIGADSSRGDRVRVLAVPFDAPALAGADEASAGTTATKADPIQIAERFSRPAVGVVAIVALVLVGAGAMRAMGGGAAKTAPDRLPAAIALLSGTDAEPLALRSSGDGQSDANAATARVLRAWLADS